MLLRVTAALGLSLLPALGADWSPRLAAEYMDARQKDWIAWPRANGGAKPCISCHTSVPYLLSRPALRQSLGEGGPTAPEASLLASLSGRLEKKGESQALGVESVMAALFLARRDPPGRMSANTLQAFDRMWELQLREGKSAGAWRWYITDMDPWEEPESELFGASLAALAAGSTPADYRARPEVKERIAALSAFLKSSYQPRPLHNSLTVAWASTRLPEAMDEVARREVALTALSRQENDGGWTLSSLGPWKKHDAAPLPPAGSDGYATAFTTYVLLQIGVKPSDPKMERALGWLRSHQDAKQGYWEAMSMNHQYPAGSMEIGFMRDAATGYATLALLSSK
jgi:squalene-hopene/tetraprenyl-beta-curcumene cyclase